ncbi:DUF1801 domain-containing protein [Saccharopolyspora erythraea]|uniref:iron chaperone n=1 Tax=Saccharopolyspora erythraea TaxID=1836 RepID=UPI001BA571DD|nr:DUF1801 domain-containing protein [Saccharopolyspora erythraea]QUH01684.1 DUF1801 domain-containing protein [Saccharopolyspora erythraea]
MVQSKAADVDGYLAELPDDRRRALERVRELCRAELTGFTEVMAYGMPGYQRDGTIEIAFAAQKRCISLYLLRTDVRDAFAQRLADHDMGKGCLRFRHADRIDFELVRDLLTATAATTGEVC